MNTQRTQAQDQADCKALAVMRTAQGSAPRNMGQMAEIIGESCDWIANHRLEFALLASLKILSPDQWPSVELRERAIEEASKPIHVRAFPEFAIP